MIKPHTQTLDTLLETTHLFGDFLAVLISWPVQIVYAWYQGLTFTFPWSSSATDEDLQSVSSDESRPQSRLKQRPQAHIRRRSAVSAVTGGVQDPVDGFGGHQIWYPPPPAYEEEDHSQVRPPQLPVPSLVPGPYLNTRSPDEWRKYPDFPAAYPLSPVLDPVPPPGFRIVAPVPKRPSDVIDIDNMSSSGQDDGDEVANNETRSGFHRSLLSSRELLNPNSAARLSDKFPTHGVQIEERTKSNKRKRRQVALEGGDGIEDNANADEESSGENAMDADEEMDEDDSEDEGHPGDMTFTTPRIKITGMTVDSDAEMEDVSDPKRENSFSFQTPLPTLRPGRGSKSNLRVKRPSSVATLVPVRNVQDARLQIDTTSLPRPFPPHPAPLLSAAASCSSWRTESTTLSTLGGGDSLMTGDASEREEIETPPPPEFPSSITYGAGTSSPFPPPSPIPDVDPTFAMPRNVRGKRQFPRTHSRNRPLVQSMAITSSSSGASSRASSRTRGNGKAQGLQPVARKKNVGGSGPPRMSGRPVAKGAENVPISMPIPILVSDSEDAPKSEKKARGDAPFLNKRQKISSTSLRKTSSSESKTMPPPRRRLATSQKPIQIAKSTSGGKKSGVVKNEKSAVRTTKVGGGGVGNAGESGGQWYSN